MSLILALGDPSEQKVPLPEALVCHQELRGDGPAGVREEPLQASQGVPDQGGERHQVQADERRQGWPGLLPPLRLQPAESEASDDDQRFWKTPHGSRQRQ